MVVTGLDRRGDMVACARVERRGSRLHVQAAEVCHLSELASLELQGLVVAISSAESCARQIEVINTQDRLPSLSRYGALAASAAARPGGTRRAAIAEQRGATAMVAIANLDVATRAASELAESAGLSGVTMIDPACAWLSLARLLGRDLPDVIVDDLADPGVVIIVDPEKSWVASEVDSIPFGSVTARSSAILTLVRAAAARRPIQTIGLAGRLADTPQTLESALGDLSQVSRLWDGVEPWLPAAGAAAAALMQHRAYEEVTL